MRSARLKFLVDVAHAAGARYLALAHSADDNVETVLHHLFRGTGPAGLAGIGSPRAIDDDLVLVRPLLGTRRQLIRRALDDAGITWRDDASNLDPGYGRNWIRHELLPVIESRYPQASEAIGRAIEGQRQWRRVIDRLAVQWLDEHQVSFVPITLRRNRDADPAIVIAAIQMLWTESAWPRGEMTQSHWLRVAKTLSSDSPQRYALPGGIEVIAESDQVTIGKV
jgi:tRNA(Ile)-lysidine synthase